MPNEEAEEANETDQFTSDFDNEGAPVAGPSRKRSSASGAVEADRANPKKEKVSLLLVQFLPTSMIK